MTDLPCDGCEHFNTKKCLSCSTMEAALPKGLRKVSIDDTGRKVAPGDLEKHGLIRCGLEARNNGLSPEAAALAHVGAEGFESLKERALSVLTEPERLVVETYFDVGDNFIAIAATLNKSKSTVRTQFREGLERIRKHFSADDIQISERLAIGEIFFHETHADMPIIRNKHGELVGDTRSTCGNGKKRNKSNRR